MEWSIEDCFSCGSCPSTLDEHRRTQTGEKLYDCDICHSSHIRKFELVLHVRCTHEPTFRSALFPKYFQRRELMGNHKRIHIDFRPDECEYCGNVFTGRDKMIGLLWSAQPVKGRVATFSWVSVRTKKRARAPTHTHTPE